MKKGLIHIYCGDGKGKTTASLGLSLRAAGAGMRVLYVQFFKDGRSSEFRLLEREGNVTFLRPEKAFGFFRTLSEAQRREAYEQILRSGDRVGMARLIRALSLQKVRLGAQHKKLHAAEEAILKEAERELNEEFAYVLGLSLEETPAFIRNLIETDEESEEAFAAHLKEKN